MTLAVHDVPRRLRALLPPASAQLALLLGAGTLFASLLPNFGTVGNATNMLAQFGPLALLALGQMCVILIRGFDISVGAVLALCTVCAALAVQAVGIVGVIAAPFVGMLIGCLNGLLVGAGSIQPIVATLGTMLAARGLALCISNNGQVVVITGDAQMQLLDFSFGQLFGLPLSSVVVLAIFLLVWLFLYWSRLGRRLFMIGGNPDAARLIGVPFERMTVLAYGICGTCAGFAAVLVLAKTSAGLPTDGFGMELQSIATAVIGGASFAGGVAQPLGVLLAALFIQLIYSALSFSSISPYAGEIVMGAVILLTGAVNRIARR